ncbi:MAG: hypothetical protein ABIT01_14830 [Thermoanaerobaculia bacterium]
MRAFALLLAFLIPAQAPTPKSPSAVSPLPTASPGDIRREVSVSRIVVDAFVTDRKGDPIPGLTPSDFRATIDGVMAEVESAEWIAAAPSSDPSAPSVPSESPVVPASEAAGPPELVSPSPAPPEGRLIVFFFQTDFTRSRLIGQVRMNHHAKKYLDTLLPSDRVAVLSFDSHLRRRLDFTRDRERIRTALFSSLKINDPEPGAVPDAAMPSLFTHISSAEARDAASVDRALELTALALAPLRGPKALLFFGWGVNVDRTPRAGVDLSNAVNALLQAHVPLFTLDVSDADSHTLQTGLQELSAYTGGTYAKTNLFPGQAMDRVRRTLLGRYELVLVLRDDGSSQSHTLAIELVGRKGTVVAREATARGR